MSTPSPAKAALTIPLPLRLVLLILEPLAALNGAYLALFHSSSFHSTLTRPSSAWSPPFCPGNQYLYTQLAGAWLLFAFNSSVILWLCDDLRLWKLMCCGMLLSDAAYHVSAVQAVGGWGRFVGVMTGGWDWREWAVMGSCVGPAVVRVWIVLFVKAAGDVKGRKKVE
ncbi:hypothetical protein QBC36DRAFT_71412 [Triangularia setosa]|uniref:DUF7704 domain-containing protein n=1 Tax=Triangularia setosa TaxID=2587417 RepID=A0AAN6W054_9PEZI|nr:hypothetical protein QBC36DRAFT_71412 [Podospora setosa]